MAEGASAGGKKDGRWEGSGETGEVDIKRGTYFQRGNGDTPDRTWR